MLCEGKYERAWIFSLLKCSFFVSLHSVLDGAIEHEEGDHGENILGHKNL